MNTNFQEINLKLPIGLILLDVILGDTFLEPRADFTTEPHKHFFFEVQFYTRGEGTIIIGDRKFQVSENDYFVIGPDVYHSHRDKPTNPLIKHCFKFEYSIKNDEQPFYTPKKEVQNIISILSGLECFHIRDTHGIIGRIAEIRKEIISPSFGSYTILQAHFLFILINILRDIAAQDKKLELPYELPNKSPLELRSKIIDNFINQNYKNNVTADDLCRLLNLSRSHLNRIMKKDYQSTFRQKLIQTRMESAKKLLIMSALTVQEISERVGYSSSDSFSLLFKQKFGISPKAYRDAYGTDAK
jgi:AraC-like DNA-binding protein